MTVPAEPEAAAPERDEEQGRDEDLLGYIERFATVLVTAGFPPMPARVFVALLISDSGRLSAVELAQKLRISPAAVSGGVRYLIQTGLVHKERVPGSRRDYYRMPASLWEDLLGLRDHVMLRWMAMVREGIGLVGPDSPARERLAHQADFLEFALKEMTGLAERWQQHLAAGGSG